MIVQLLTAALLPVLFAATGYYVARISTRRDYMAFHRLDGTPERLHRLISFFAIIVLILIARKVIMITAGTGTVQTGYIYPYDRADTFVFLCAFVTGIAYYFYRSKQQR